jgi:hypothetical protein
MYHAPRLLLIDWYQSAGGPTARCAQPAVCEAQVVCCLLALPAVTDVNVFEAFSKRNL